MEKEYLDVPFKIKSEDVKDDGTFFGYGSTFGGEPDSHRHVVEKGAFVSSLQKNGRNRKGVAMLWQHKSDEIPGVWSKLQEDAHGLYVEGKLLMDTQLGKETFSRLKAKAIGGLSIGYDLIKYEVDEKEEFMTLKEIDLWEISLVTFPANIHASVLGVKCVEALKQAETPRELEHALRDLGLSKSTSQYLVKLCRPSLREAKEKPVDELNALLSTIRQVNLGLRVNREVQNAIF